MKEKFVGTHNLSEHKNNIALIRGGIFDVLEKFEIYNDALKYQHKKFPDYLTTMYPALQVSDDGKFYYLLDCTEDEFRGEINRIKEIVRVSRRKKLKDIAAITSIIVFVVLLVWNLI